MRWHNYLIYSFFEDLFLFGEASEAQAYLLESVIQEFCDISAQKINVGKSKLYVSQNIDSAIAIAISNKWSIPLTSSLGKYLSCPVIHS